MRSGALEADHVALAGYLGDERATCSNAWVPPEHEEWEQGVPIALSAGLLSPKLALRVGLDLCQRAWDGCGRQPDPRGAKVLGTIRDWLRDGSGSSAILALHAELDGLCMELMDPQVEENPTESRAASAGVAALTLLNGVRGVLEGHDELGQEEAGYAAREAWEAAADPEAERDWQRRHLSGLLLTPQPWPEPIPPL